MTHAAAIDLQGLWASDGYGWLLEIDAAGYALHHVNALNAVRAESGSRDDFAAAYEVAVASRTRLELHQRGDITRYGFRRIDGFPAVPRIAAPGAERDALINFDTLWQTFAEHYAFFGLRGVDWDEIRRRHRPRLSASSTEAQLLEVFADLLLPLGDGHVSLAVPQGQSIQCLGSMPLRRAAQTLFGMPQPRVSARSTVDAVSARLARVMLAPFGATRTELRSAGNGILSWCRLTADVGYLSVLRLFGFADTAAARAADDLPHARRDVAQFLADDLAALESALDAIFTDLHGCRGLVLDLRLNGGGFDRCGLAIADRFADAARLAFTKRARAGAGFTATQDFMLRPAERPGFSGPVQVLSSPLCVSAGEILLLCLRALPQVRALGQPSAGMLSDNLNKPLPNGWELSLSNEIYASADGEVFEGRGVVPDAELAATDAQHFEAALRASLVQAVAMLGDGPVLARHARA